MRLIDADELKKFIYVMPLVERMIDIQQTVDAVPLERDIPKKPTDQQLEEDGYGAWGSLYGKCPNCEKSVYDEQNYCEKCGQRLYWGKDASNRS